MLREAEHAGSGAGTVRRGIRGWIRPAGLCVAVLGPDGSGKSSVIARYVPAMEPLFTGSEFFHLRPHLLRGTASGRVAPSTDPHGQVPRGALMSTAKILYLWADYLLGYWLRVWPLLAHSRLVIFDRYYHDLMIDTLRFRYGGPLWLVRVVARLIPLPDLILVLDAPADVLQARKQEVSAEESARQARAYRRIAGSPAVRGRAILVDASRPLEEVVHECTGGTLALLARRNARRRRLD